MLPVELSDKIIDLLAGKKKALARCSLVSKTWADRSRIHLWKDLELKCEYDSVKLKRFIGFVRSSPVVANMVINVTLSYYSEPREGDSEYPRGGAFALLEALPALETLTLDRARFWLLHTANVDFTTKVKTLSIKDTIFSDIRDFHNLVCALPSLTDLAVGPDVKWTSWDDTDAIEDYAFKVDRLQIGADDIDGSFITWLSLLSSVDVTTVCLTHMPRDFYEVADWFESAWDACIRTARSLELDLRYIEGKRQMLLPLLR